MDGIFPPIQLLFEKGKKEYEETGAVFGPVSPGKQDWPGRVRVRRGRRYPGR